MCTFHDLFVLTGDYSDAEFRARFAKQAREAATCADLILCVSTYTAVQVRELLHVDAGRLRVVPHGVHAHAAAPLRSREKMVLHVGALQARKNILRLIEAFELALPGHRLALAGSDGYRAGEIHARIAKSPSRDRIDVLGYVDQRKLDDLYARAGLLAFPSLDEGFGIPVLEAMQRGLPVLTSNCSALREAAGDAALLVNPLDVGEIAAGMRELATDEALRSALVARGLSRAAEFSWDRAVERTWKIYEELL